MVYGILIKDKIPIKTLKELCKLYKLRKYSKLKKIEIIEYLNKYLNSIKIQRFIRNKWIDGICPISMEKIKYPCYAFRPKGFIIDKSKSRLGSSFIYYNLEPLINYLITSGDFRDPKTREKYNENVIKSIERCRIKAGIKSKNVFKASSNNSIYRKKREREDDILVLERCIDEVLSSIRSVMETETLYDQRITLNTFHFPTFHRYFRNLLYKSEECAHQIIKRTISIITGPESKPTLDPNKLKDFILQFLYTLMGTYFD